jgi:hypothetical protein
MVWGEVFMILTTENLELVKSLSREIDFGRITIDIVGHPSNLVTIKAEKSFRFHYSKAESTNDTAQQRQSNSRY